LADTLIHRLPADLRAPAAARAWLANTARLDQIRGAEAGLLLSDLVTLAIDRAPANEDIEVRLDIRPTAVAVEVAIPGGNLEVDDELTRSLLDRMARRWGHRQDAKTSVWFEVRAPGGASESIGSLDTDDLLVRAAQEPDARDEVIRRLTPMALGIARRYRGKGISQDDLDQVALLGMLRALDRYDPSIGAFEPYAAKTISGELKRQLRDRAWSVRVPRSLQERSLRVTRVTQELTQRLGRVPTPGDIAQELDITVDEVLEARGASSAYTSASLDAPFDNDSGWSLGDSLGGEDAALALADKWHGLGPALESLPERQRKILYLRFYEDMTQSEIAEIVGISQMHVSRLLARAIDRLRTLVE
jgi:RNA polymerase sigma-B factor